MNEQQRLEMAKAPLPDTIAEAWQRYRKAVLPTFAPSDLVTAFEKAFWAGAVALWEMTSDKTAGASIDEIKAAPSISLPSEKIDQYIIDLVKKSDPR